MTFIPEEDGLPQATAEHLAEILAASFIKRERSFDPEAIIQKELEVLNSSPSPSSERVIIYGPDEIYLGCARYNFDLLVWEWARY